MHKILFLTTLAMLGQPAAFADFDSGSDFGDFGDVDLEASEADIPSGEGDFIFSSPSQNEAISRPDAVSDRDSIVKLEGEPEIKIPDPEENRQPKDEASAAPEDASLTTNKRIKAKSPSEYELIQRSKNKGVQNPERPAGRVVYHPGDPQGKGFFQTDVQKALKKIQGGSRK